MPRWLRVLLLVVLLGGLLAAARLTPLGDLLERDALRAAVQGAGALGVALFVVAFVAGELAHIPGLVFVGVAVLVYGQLWGGLLAYAAALASIAASFCIVRTVGGRALAEAKGDLMRRLLAPLEARPVRTVIILRAVFILAPPLNYALALSPVRFRDYMLGSAIGLSAPMIVAVLLFDRLI